MTELLASNNVYSEEVIINSESSLSVYEALGDKLTIVNADVTITQSLTNGVDAARLQAVVDKMVTVTKDITYTHSGVGVTAVNFSALTGVATMTLNQEAPISLPSLVSAGNIKVTKNNKVTSFSAPALTSVMSFNTGTANELDLSASATSIDLSALVNVTSGALTVETKSTGTIDLTALSPIVATTGKANSNFSLKTAGAKSIALPGYIDGALETDAEVVTLVAFKNAPTFTGTNNLEELHMHAVEADLTNALKDETNISILDIIGVVPTTGSTEVVKGDSPVGIKITDASELTSLTLAGNIGVVDLDSATNLTSVTTSGAILSFKLDNATDLTELTLGHGPSSTSTYKRSDLVITGATSLESLTADSVNNANTLTITGNTSLETISLAGLKAVATAKTAMKPRVTISGNALDISSFQLPSTVNTTPVVDGKITTTSGVDGLQAYLDKAIAATGSIVSVIYDDVAQIVDAEGEVYTEDTNTSTVSVTYATSKSVTVTAGSTFTLVNISPDTREYAGIGVRYQTNTMALEAGSALSDMSSDNTEFVFNGGEGAVTLELTSAFRNNISDYDRTDASTWAPEIADAMQEKITAAGYNYTLDAYNDYGASAAYTINLYSSTGVETDSDAVLSSGGVVWVSIGSTQVSATVAAGADSDTQFAAAVVSAIEGTGSPLSSSWSATSASEVVTLKKTRTVNNTWDRSYVGYPNLTFGSYTTDTNTSALLSGASVTTNKVESKGWRFTAQNTNLSVKAANLEAGMSFFSEGTIGAANFTVTAVGDDAQYATSTSTLQVGFDDVQEADNSVVSGQPAATVDFTAWM
ncbi:MAG: hypothetical protein MRY51_05950 [Flavobacteriaceae bacterium]|nr:hypothetical protein [Flavobacteriaceae bacterium]MCI5087798.1 hypothetical protein [Flavobacteriaceae bacterium]